MKTVNRPTLIAQLRSLLHMAESPNYDYVEGDIGDTDISVDVTSKQGRSDLIGALRQCLGAATNPHQNVAVLQGEDLHLCFNLA
jgi:hypothetical protein